MQKIKLKFSNFFPNFSKKFGEFYFYLTEIIVPPVNKTRLDGWHSMQKFFSPDLTIEAENRRELQRKLIFERFWIALEEVIDLLAAVFIAYLLLGLTALHVDIPRISELAKVTLANNFTIHFFAGVFIFLRILILLRDKFTSWSFARTSLLFFTGSLLIILAGINLL